MQKLKDLAYTDAQIEDIKIWKREGLSWLELTEKYNDKYKDSTKRSADALRKTYTRYEDFSFSDDEKITNIRQAHSARKTRSIVAKQNKTILDYLDNKEDLLSEFNDLFNRVKFARPKASKRKKAADKKNMKIEVMLTDLHYGKKTKTFGIQSARSKMDQMGKTVIGEIERFSSNYNVEEVITYLGGDIIENADFHGKESAKGCDCTTSQQVAYAIESIYEDYIAPLVSTGVKCHVVCITGNHDRIDMHKTYQDPGLDNLTYVIYKSLELICRKAGLDEITFDIPDGVFTTYDIYGSTVLYEHGDHIKGGMTRVACESHMAKRSKQLNTLINFMRLGHFHEPTMYGRGKVIVNGSFPGQDSYAEINGYSTESAQTINFYIETTNRPNSFYHSFPVYLKD